MFKGKYEKYKCKQEYTDGGFYDGEFMDGQRHGVGFMRQSNGATLQGDWIRGKLAGGVIVYSDGWRHEGGFIDNKAHGPGRRIDPQGKVVAEGIFEHGQYVSEAEMRSRDEARAREERARIERERVAEAQRAREASERAEREQAEIRRIAREGDGSAHDQLCKRYGLRPSTAQYVECRTQLDRHEKEQAEQRRLYEQRLAEYERERERRRGEALFLLGMGMLANSSRPVAQPMMPMPQPPPMQSFNLFVPGRPPINCLSNLNVIDCR